MTHDRSRAGATRSPRSEGLHPTEKPQRALRLKAWRLVALVAALLVCGALAATVLIRPRTAVEGWSQRTAAHEPRSIALADLQPRFARAGQEQALGSEDYRRLALHLLEGWSQYRSPDGARAHYPGLPSEAGRAADGLEGFSRMLPLAAVLLLRGEDPPVGPELRLSEAIRFGLLAGTNDTHPAYWGSMRAYSPQYVEAADIALGLWIARSVLWDSLSSAEKSQVSQWLAAALELLPHDGNWMVFPLLVHRSLQALGEDVSRFDARVQTHWERLLHLHRGRGWFHDPPHGFDYYNAWSIHHAFYWLRQLDPSFGGAFVPEIQGEFASFLRHLIGPHGHPPLGRSTCYRMALVAPLMGSLEVVPGAVPPGQALRALDLSWSWFIGQGAVRAGGITAGLCHADPALQSGYSGPASCLWAARSLTVALDLDHRQTGLLDAPREPLPVEREAFVLRHAGTGWVVRGDPSTGHVVLDPNSRRRNAEAPALQEHGRIARGLEWLMHRPMRPDNRAALYERPRYATDDDIARRCIGATVPALRPSGSTIDR